MLTISNVLTAEQITSEMRESFRESVGCTVRAWAIARSIEKRIEEGSGCQFDAGKSYIREMIKEAASCLRRRGVDFVSLLTDENVDRYLTADPTRINDDNLKPRKVRYCSPFVRFNPTGHFRGGFNVVLECGHDLWTPYQPVGETLYCIQCAEKGEPVLRTDQRGLW